MNLRIVAISNLILFSIIMFGCTNAQISDEAEKAFTDVINNCEMNEKLRFSYVGKLFDGDRNINLRLEPSSNVSVIFPAGYNLQLLTFDSTENEWAEVSDGVTYMQVGEKFILGNNDPSKEFTQKLIGIIPLTSTKSMLRAVVHGNVYQNKVETDQCTGAFIDFEFVP